MAQGNKKSSRDGSGNLVSSTASSLRLLEALAAAGKSMRVSDLARGTGYTTTKVHRHLTTLKLLGYVTQAADTEQYRLGWKLFRLGQSVLEQFDLKGVSAPYMLRLRDELDLTTVLAVPDGANAWVIASYDQLHGPFKISVDLGVLPDVTASALGRIVLAYTSGRFSRSVLEHAHKQYTPYTITDTKIIARRLETIRQRLYESASQETSIGVNALAAPIFGSRGDFLGVVGIVGPLARIPEKPLPGHIQALQNCARDISRHFGLDDYSSMAERPTKDC